MVRLQLKKNDIIPKYYQLKEQVRRRIEKGVLKPGDSLPSEPQIVDKLGLSRNTIRQAMAELEQEGFIVREQGRGTFVARAERPAGRKKIVAGTGVGIAFFKTGQMKHPYMSRLFHSIGACATDYRFHTQLFVAKGEHFGSVRSLLRQAILSQRINGLLLVEEGEKENLDFLVEIGFPFVVVNMEFMTHRELPTVKVDSYRATLLGLEHLLRLGHRRIGLLCGPFSYPGSGQRFASHEILQAYKDCLEQFGIPFDPQLVQETSYLLQEGRDFTRQLLQLPSRPTALLTTDDILAFGAKLAVAEKHLRIPGDVSIVALGDLLGMADLTVVQYPFDEMAGKAVRMLSCLLEGTPIHCLKENINGRLIVRGSTTAYKP